MRGLLRNNPAHLQGESLKPMLHTLNLDGFQHQPALIPCLGLLQTLRFIIFVSSCVRRVRSSARKPSEIWVHSEQLKRSCTCPADFINSTCVFHAVKKEITFCINKIFKNGIKLHLPCVSSATQAFPCISLEMLKRFW